MGSGHSQEHYQTIALETYEETFQSTCIIPDISIDESLLKYSGLDSNSVLQSYSSVLINSVPDFVKNLGSALGPITSVPNAVGLGAFVISLIMEISIKGFSQPSHSSYSMFRRVFGEEKASAVRDTMSEYVSRHHIYLNNEQRLREELQRLERQLSHELTALRNSLLLDGQMSSRGLKIWVNGASFHLQMLIHEARLSTRTRNPASEYVGSISAAISLRLLDLNKLLERYKAYKISQTSFHEWSHCVYLSCAIPECQVRNHESGCIQKLSKHTACFAKSNDVVNYYVTNFFTSYEPVSGLKSHFLNMKNNLNSLINQHDAFILQ